MNNFSFSCWTQQLHTKAQPENQESKKDCVQIHWPVISDRPFQDVLVMEKAATKLVELLYITKSTESGPGLFHSYLVVSVIHFASFVVHLTLHNLTVVCFCMVYSQKINK